MRKLIDKKLMREEIRALVESLTDEQKEDMKKYVNLLDYSCPIKGCPDIWDIHSQAWLLDNGLELEHCNHKTADELMGCAIGTIDKFIEVMNHE